MIIPGFSIYCHVHVSSTDRSHSFLDHEFFPLLTLSYLTAGTPSSFSLFLLYSEYSCSCPSPLELRMSNREAVERALFVGRWDDGISTEGSVDSAIAKLAKDVIDGSFRSVLTSDHAQRILKTKATLENLDAPIASWFDFASIAEEDRSSPLPLIIGIACLHSYIQPNYTGPDLDVKPLEVFRFLPNLDVTEETLHRRATTELAHGGEPAYHLAQVPIFLAVAEALWDVAEATNTVVWWRLRTWLLREQILDEPVGLPQSIWDTYAPSVSRDLIHLSLVGLSRMRTLSKIQNSPRTCERSKGTSCSNKDFYTTFFKMTNLQPSTSFERPRRMASSTSSLVHQGKGRGSSNSTSHSSSFWLRVAKRQKTGTRQKTRKLSLTKLILHQGRQRMGRQADPLSRKHCRSTMTPFSKKLNLLPPHHPRHPSCPTSTRTPSLHLTPWTNVSSWAFA